MPTVLTFPHLHSAGTDQPPAQESGAAPPSPRQSTVIHGPKPTGATLCQQSTLTLLIAACVLLKKQHWPPMLPLAPLPTRLMLVRKHPLPARHHTCHSGLPTVAITQLAATLFNSTPMAPTTCSMLTAKLTLAHPTRRHSVCQPKERA